MEVGMPEGPATGRNCCAASDWVRQRTAASRHAVLDYYQQCVVQVRGGAGQVLHMGCLLFHLRPWLLACAVRQPACPAPPQPQLTEQLAAAEARRPVDVVVQPVLRLGLPEALQQQPLWMDLCHECAKHLEQVGGSEML